MKSLLHFSLLLLTLELLHLCINAIPVHSQCYKQHKLSLLQLKKSLIFNDSASKLISWNSSTDCCSWAGVTCTEGRVVGLDISSQSILGGLDSSSSLFDLQNLENLNLADNKVGSGSQIPSTIGKLTKLSYLNLSNAAFEGQIPIEISYLTGLVILDLSVNLGSSTCCFPESPSLKLENPNLNVLVANLSKLIELYLDGVNISAQGTEWCQAVSSSLPKLKVLSLSACNLSGPVDSSLLKLQSLSVIHLANNTFFAHVPDFFSNFSNLTSLHLMNCELHGVLPKKIFQVPTLHTIDLSDNPQLQGSLPEFPKNGSLWSLDLSYCNFSGPIPKSIADLTELVYLDLSGNKFNGSPFFSMSNNLSNNDPTGLINYTHWENLMKLVNLDLRHNQLEGSIPSTLFFLPRLKYLRLSYNHFSGQLDEFSNVSSYFLKTVTLSYNNLEGPIPTSILKFRGLKILLLSSNNFSGSFLLNGLQQLRNLSNLDLSLNSLSAVYDDTNSSLSSFPPINTLKLASCKLRNFPGFLRNLSELRILDLSQNQIYGEIPNWIWRLGNLFLLNLSYNSLVTIEGPFLNLTSVLSVVDLHSNQLQGQIPYFPPFPAYLDYSSNNFSSSIQIDIGDYLAKTRILSLSNNNFYGIIPTSICNAPALEVLDLSNNSLHGLSPQCLTAMSDTLVVLNIRRNQISGTIPDKFSVNCTLKTLDLSGNQLEGRFPKSLENCKMLDILNLGNNQILDTFPLLLKSISSLRALVLRSNQFYGRIGCPKINGTWSKLQILDIAHNNFSGEIPGQCLKTWQAMMGEEDDVQSKLKQFSFEFPIFNELYYQDVITVTNKGIEMVLMKILTIFTSIDVSSNNFNGSIPEEMGELKSLYALNLSSNAFIGAIPSSLSNLRLLESLDIANNKLDGIIPPEFAKLNFLSFPNVSNNQLVGMIPRSTQMSTFPTSCFAGNKGLFGPPLTGDNTSKLFPTTSNGSLSNSRQGIDRVLNHWIGAEIGFIVGLGGAVGSLMFCKRWSKWYYRAMYNILLKIFPQLAERIGQHQRHVYINQRWKRNTS